MNIVLMLLPALAWGILPLVVAKIGGAPSQQIFGTAFGTLIASVIVYIILRTTTDLKSTILAALAGAFWIIGQLGQYTGYQKLGVSKTMPLSTGLQLIGTALIGVVMFGEWSSSTAKIFGFLGIIMLIVGIILTSARSTNTDNSNQFGTIIMLIFTTVGYLIYNVIPKELSSSGLAIFLPESVGMVLAVLAYAIFTHNTAIFKDKLSWKNIIGGLVFSFAAVTYILSVKQNGVNTAFIVGQTSVVISTIGGLVLLNERKTRRELILMVIGLILIVGGAVITTVF